MSYTYFRILCGSKYNFGEEVEQKKSYNEVEWKKDLRYLGERVNESGGCETVVTKNKKLVG